MRFLNSAAAGLITGLLLYFIITLATINASTIVFLACWAAFAFLFYHKADSISAIWTRACLVVAVECLIIPLASWVLPYFYGEQAVQAARQGAQAAGQAFGSTLGGGMITMLSGYFGLIIGFLLLATAYFSLKPARRRR